MKRSTLALITTLIAPPIFAAEGSSKTVATNDIEWGGLNSLHGVLSPGAADIWGDRITDTIEITDSTHRG
ncbi:hypothetical protein ACQKPX_17225 [Photobacterium sp. DNB23_23_1]